MADDGTLHGQQVGEAIGTSEIELKFQMDTILSQKVAIVKSLSSSVMAAIVLGAVMSGCREKTDAPDIERKSEPIDLTTKLEKKEPEQIVVPTPLSKMPDTPKAGPTEKEENRKLTPLEAFEQHIARVQRELPKLFPITVHETTTMSGSVDLNLSMDEERQNKLAYDVRSTNSLVSPYNAYLTFSCSARGTVFRKTTSGSIMCRVTYAYQSDRWTFKSFEVEDIAGIDFSPDEFDRIIKLEKEIACLALSENLVHGKRLPLTLVPQQ